MKRFTALFALAIFSTLGTAQAQTAKHSATLTLTPSTTACVSPCVMTYEIYRGTAAGAENMTTPINPTPLSATRLSFVDINVSPGSTYFYVARAVETSGTVVLTSANSKEVSFTFPQAPAPPGLTIVVVTSGK